MIKRKIAKILISAGVVASILSVSPVILANAQPLNKTATYSVYSNNSNIPKAVLNTNVQLANGVAHKYDMVAITGTSKENYNVITQYGVSGSIPKTDLTIVKSGIGNQLIKINETEHVIHVSTDLNVREQPAVHAGLLTTLKNKDNVQVIGKQGEWLEVNINGQNGFVYNDFIQEGSITQNNISSNATSTKTNDSSKKVVSSQVNTPNKNNETSSKTVAKKTQTTKENNLKSSVLSKYNIAGTWKITNQAAYPEDTNGETQVLTGDTVVIKPDMFKFGNTTIKNPTYAVQEAGMSSFFGHPGDVGKILNNNWSMTVLTVNGQNSFSNNTIIIGNGKIQVINKISYVYNAERI